MLTTNSDMKRIKIGLLTKIIIAIGSGIGIGLIAPEWLVRTFLTFNSIFSQFLGFAIPLIIIGLIVPAISDIGKDSGKAAAADGCDSLWIHHIFRNGFVLYRSCCISWNDRQQRIIGQRRNQSRADALFHRQHPPVMGVMTALILSFTLGLGLAAMDSHSLKDVMHDFEQVIIKTIKTAIIPLLPLYIFGIFLDMTYDGQVFSILSVFIKIIGIIFLIHIGILMLQFSIAGIIARKNPFRMLWNMLPAYFTALGTQSSAATIGNA